MPLHNSVLKSVVTINTMNGKKLICIGTGILVGYPVVKEDKEGYATFIITNKHVIQDSDIFYVSVNKKNGGVNNAQIVKKDVLEKKEMFFHQDESVDICAIHLNYNYVTENDCDTAFVILGDFSLTINQMKDFPIFEGNLVYAVGFPMNLVEEEYKYPIVRIGNIARISDLYYTNKKLKKFTVDTECYPGNSGSPIFTSIENQTFITNSKKVDKNYLIGVLNSYIPYQETLISIQTKRPRFVQEENSGLTEVFSVDYILDVLEMFDIIKDLKKKLTR